MPISGTYTANSATTYKDALVEVELTGANVDWDSLLGWATDVEVSGEDIPTEETKPFGSSPIVFVGIKGPVTVRVTSVYTEGSTDPFHNIHARFEAAPGGTFDVRFAPKGSTAGNKRFVTTGGKLTAVSIPGGSGDGANASRFTFTVVADSIAQGTI